MVFFDACRAEWNEAGDEDWDARFHAVMRGVTKSDGENPVQARALVCVKTV